MNRIWGLMARMRQVRLTPARVRNLALALVLPAVVVAGGLALGGPAERMTARGPIQSGHAGLTCKDCHVSAPGTLRQQTQANLRYLFGLRPEAADFGYAAVSSEACTDCHARPNERHPIYRFREPRFQKARATVDATTCLGCHAEHRAERVAAPLDFCKACHESLVLKVDPLDQPHDVLIAAAAWETCLGCHDFHGNHAHDPPVRLLEAKDVAALLAYLKDGSDPYSEAKIHKAGLK
jgi:hypothetical protein